MIKGKEAKIYNYIESVVNAVSNYYGYELIKNANLKDILDNKNSDEKKYHYLDSQKCSFVSVNINSVYQDAEMISMIYRILEELGIEDIEVSLKDGKTDTKKLQEYLEYLDVDYELGEKDKDSNFAFLFKVMVSNKEIILGKGERCDSTLSGILEIDKIAELLKVIFEDRNMDAMIQVYIVGESEEERIAAMKLAQDLRWCEIIVDVDLNGKSKEEQMKLANSNFIIVMESDNLNKGLIKVIDNLTSEETLVDEAEIIDYIVSNI